MKAKTLLAARGGYASAPIGRWQLGHGWRKLSSVGQRFIHEYGEGGAGNVLRAALDVGFGSYVQFHRAFKQVTGYPPATHLERVREGIVDPALTGRRFPE